MTAVRLPLVALLAANSTLTGAARLAAQPPDPEQALVAALGNDKLFLKGEYKPVRAAFAAYFERKYAAEIKAAFGAEADAVTAFLNQNPDLKETLYTAIDPEHDQVEAALTVFKGLYALGPDKLKSHAPAAVACAVVWDDPKAAYDYRGHARRTRSVLPEGLEAIGAKENYLYLVEQETALKGMVQNLPWEFLVHVVNHRTPVDERKWAVKNYLKRRTLIGTTYKDIRYDTDMLRSELRNGAGQGDCRLTGQPYTLEGIKANGGVCAMQADFAARVAKSVGVPAEFVGGEANSGGLHAWVMWVEVKGVNRDKVDFVLASEGRYLVDQYYVGTLKDPKTGRETTDRDMERRLATVGAAPLAARQADLLMRAFPAVRDAKNLSPKQQLAYLARVFEVFPHSERAWRELAALSKDGKQPDPAEAYRYAERAFNTFAKFPDFSWQVFDDLLTAHKDKFQRARLYEKVVDSYEALGRPDLACEARLTLAGYQVEAKDYKKAADGLARTIKRFPAEGRYVPKMLAKLEEVCDKDRYKEGPKFLAKVYLEFLPKVPTKRGDEVSKYAVEMYQKGLDFFRAQKNDKQAEAIRQRLDQLKKGRG